MAAAAIENGRNPGKEAKFVGRDKEGKRKWKEKEDMNYLHSHTSTHPPADPYWEEGSFSGGNQLVSRTRGAAIPGSDIIQIKRKQPEKVPSVSGRGDL